MSNKKLLFLDSANIDDVLRVSKTTAIAGVTTNPSLMAKEEKGDYFQKLCALAYQFQDKVTLKHFSVEPVGFDLIEEAEKLNISLSKRNFPTVDLHIKIPLTIDNLGVISLLEKRGIKVNATACMTFQQAKMALDAGASVVSFFYNRAKDGGVDIDKEIEDTSVYIYDQYYRYNDTEEYQQLPLIICGSIRKPDDVQSAWEASIGLADLAVTAPMKVIEKLAYHPKTDEAIEGFERDLEEWLK